jgi:hypothetical protein
MMVKTMAKTVLTKEAMLEAEAQLNAEEEKIKRKWCELKGHRWDLPQPNPLNSDSLDCQIRCNRCNITGTLSIVVDKYPEV